MAFKRMRDATRAKKNRRALPGGIQLCDVQVCDLQVPPPIKIAVDLLPASHLETASAFIRVLLATNAALRAFRRGPPAPSSARSRGESLFATANRQTPKTRSRSKFPLRDQGNCLTRMLR